MRDEDWMPDTAEIWAIALTDLKITGKELALAQRKSMSLEWPPTAPADFLALGRTETASEYPSAQTAFTTACQNCGMRGDVKRDWKHEVIYETANRIGWGVLASATEHYFKTFQGVYDEVVREHKNGTRFDIPQERQLAYERTVLQENSPMAATVDDFLNQFKRKHGEAV